MNKKGAELSMNIIIITILVVIVLVIMAVFFTGGMASLTKKISNIFSGQLTDIAEASTKCNAYCANYQNQKSDIIQSTMVTNFCTNEFSVDLNGDGKITSDEEKKTCSNLGISCGITCG